MHNDTEPEKTLGRATVRFSGLPSVPFNAVTCGDCGNVLVHVSLPATPIQGDFRCPLCGFEDDPSSFPDLQLDLVQITNWEQ